ncbi:RagB/SusD family nutrient uptake outer membrane protein [Pedobacter cryophilus]|uniref:RagB/SusD family nutrient uptake outer membrane protein n=1 Tax=Pedobacter cryophilus TaxID=2571271 RepID=A0A4U1BUA4_9SPHI|nr:RagB/SusD family nutrient uptake outer membrane protein [Pedobacter cryophilus]TKB96252.1 RagB/SusD family nutrient uptake outer membrane protein [Pedobacter cryophilus]
MKLNIKHITAKVFFIGMLLLCLMGTSCKKWLELKPEDGLIDQEYWRTKEQLKGAVMGCYASLLGGSTMPLAKYLFIWGELRGDMVTTGTDLGGEENVSALNNLRRDELYMLRTELSSNNSLINWEAVYITINYCNDVIENGPKVLDSDKTLTETQLKAYLSEAYALRGLMYFYLLRNFKEVPLKLEVTATDKAIKQQPKNTEQEIYTQIISDVTYASENAPVSYGSLAEDRGRITKFTAFTILADAYLWMEDYQNCLTACEQVIASGRYQLFPAGTIPANWYRDVFFDGNSVEGIFEFQFDNQKQNPFWDMFGASSREFKALDWIAEGDLFGVDFNNPNNRDIRGNGTSMNEATSGIAKYTNSRTNSTSFSHWFVYRYSDVLLMKAEALVWLNPGDVNNATKAIEIVDKLRFSRNALSNLASTSVEVPDPTAETQEISKYVFNERSREFAFEGKRWYDILRNAKRNNYQDEKILLDIVSAKALPSKQQTVINKFKDRRSHYLPIYFTELQTNKALVQNPFYQ